MICDQDWVIFRLPLVSIMKQFPQFRYSQTDCLFLNLQFTDFNFNKLPDKTNKLTHTPQSQLVSDNFRLHLFFQCKTVR